MAVLIDPEGHEIDALTAMVPDLAGCRIVEIGCGDGRLTRRYAGRDASVLAIDPDETAIASFRANMPKGEVDVRAMGLDQLRVPDGTIDVVLLSWSL